MRSRSFIVAISSVVLASVVVAGCSSDSKPSAEEQVCTDAGDLKKAVNTLVSDIKSGNFGAAQDQLTRVQSAFSTLRSSAEDLASEKKASVQQDLDGVKSTLGDITSATSLSDIQNTLTKAGDELKSTADAVTKTLSC